MPHGRELRFIIGGVGREDQLMHSNVFRDAQALADCSTGTRQTFTAKGWAVVAAGPERLAPYEVLRYHNGHNPDAHRMRQA